MSECVTCGQAVLLIEQSVVGKLISSRLEFISKQWDGWTRACW
jgi:hypothetical protein